MELKSLVFWAVWPALQVGVFAYGWITQMNDDRLAALNRLRWSVWTSRGAGLVLALDGVLILLPVLRNVLCVIRPRFRWLPLDDNLFFHKQVAYSFAFFTLLHVNAHYINFYQVEKTQLRPFKAWQIHYEQVGGVTGHIMLLCMVLMFTSARLKIRKRSFETFWYMHSLSIVFFSALLAHASGCFVRDTVQAFSPFDIDQFWKHCIGYQSWRIQIIPVLLYAGERLWREYRSRLPTAIKRVIAHPLGVIELQIEKESFNYKAGQYLYVMVPELSVFQWHPFTISSSPQDPFISVHIRQVGDWTKALGERLGISRYGSGRELEQAQHHCKNLPAIWIDGPYGSPAQDVEQERVAILCGAGIGITPFSSVLRTIFYNRHKRVTQKLQHVELLWVCKDLDSLVWIQDLLVHLQSDLLAEDSFRLRVSIFVTGAVDIEDIHNYALNTSSAKHDPFTHLSTRLSFGRPDFNAYLSAVAKRVSLSGNQKQPVMLKEGIQMQKLTPQVGFYFCGPRQMTPSIRSACKSQSSDLVQFRFHKENF